MARHSRLPAPAGLAALVALLAVSCARMGQPDGGWFDDTPPRVVRTSPAERATGVRAHKVSISFDEFVKLQDATSKVVVSPPQLETPDIKTSGKRIVIDLKDSLKANTTYTIDFSDAIVDNNEGNPMGNYTYCFSTGGRIDTLEVAGTVLDASNLEPVKGILVGLYDDLADSAFRTKPLLRVARTDSRGRFTVRGVAPGRYRCYALNDQDGDYRYSQKSEMVAFSHRVIEPSCRPDIRQDTVWRDSLRIDTIMRVPYTHFEPDNVVLRAFAVTQTDRYLLKADRTDARMFTLFFTYGSDRLPEVRGLNFSADSAFFVEASARRDTVSYWLRDTALVNRDTLQLELTYLMTDSTGTLASKTDTLEVLAKTPFAKREKERARELEKWQKKMDKARKRGERVDSVMPAAALEPKFLSSSSLDPDQNVLVEMPAPLEHCDTAAIHLYVKHDTLWYSARKEWERAEGHLRRYRLLAEWRPGLEYSLEIDSAAFRDIYGNVSAPITQGIRIRSLDEYATLTVNVTVPGSVADSTLVVQLLNGSDEPVKEARVAGGSADFYYLAPQKYYMRAFVDANGNGVWDTGDYDRDVQPELVFYNPRQVECKAKWDITHSWNLAACSAERQKPDAITRQKAGKERRLRNRNADRAARLGVPEPAPRRR